jgi:hypothetical protein
MTMERRDQKMVGPLGRTPATTRPLTPGRCPGLGEPRPFGAKQISVFLIAVLLAMFFPCGPVWAAGEEPSLTVKVDRTAIYEGDSVLYQVTLDRVENPPAPNLDGFDRDFNVTLIQKQPYHSRSFRMDNFQSSVVERYGCTFLYSLTPKRTGELTIPAPTAEVKGETLRGRAIEISVEAAARQDVVRMEITCKPAAVYPLQPFTVTLSIAVKALPEPLADRDPLRALSNNPPQIEIPWLVDRRLPAGLDPEVDVDRWRSRYVHTMWGFDIVSLPADPFSVFSRHANTYLSPPDKIQLPDKDGKPAVYWRYQFTRTFTATKVDVFTFGPAKLKGAFVVAVDEDGRLTGKEIYAVAKALHVAIKDVPTEGRPDSYCGAIGQFDLSADLAPRQAKTGDPMTLTLTLSGQGSLDDATAPDLTKLPGIAGKFKVYDATEQTKGNDRQFTYSLRPLDAGVTEFPAIPVAYFDVEKERFFTLQTKPIPVEISRAAALSGRDVVSANGASAPPGDLELQKGGIFANMTDPGLAVDQGVDAGRWLIGLGGISGAYALLVFGVVSWRRLSADPIRLRRRAAPSEAHKRLHDGLKLLGAGRNREGIEQIEQAVKHLIADWTGAPAAGLTAGESARLLGSLGVNRETIDATARLLETCEAVRYGGTAADLGALRREAKPTMHALLKALRRAK